MGTTTHGIIFPDPSAVPSRGALEDLADSVEASIWGVPTLIQVGGSWGSVNIPSSARPVRVAGLVQQSTDANAWITLIPSWSAIGLIGMLSIQAIAADISVDARVAQATVNGSSIIARMEDHSGAGLVSSGPYFVSFVVDGWA